MKVARSRAGAARFGAQLRLICDLCHSAGTQCSLTPSAPYVSKAPVPPKLPARSYDYTKGLCTRGDKCKYSHDLATIVSFNSKEKGGCCTGAAACHSMPSCCTAAILCAAGARQNHNFHAMLYAALPCQFQPLMSCAVTPSPVHLSPSRHPNAVLPCPALQASALTTCAISATVGCSVVSAMTCPTLRSSASLRSRR